MVYRRKSWMEKLHDDNGLPKVEVIGDKLASKWKLTPGDTLAIPAPIEVDEMMRQVPEGKLVTINEIRKAVAKKHRATIGCPITCGIFARIAAGAAEESLEAGNTNITPYWRTLRSDGSLNEKYPGGIETQKRLLEDEGHSVIRKGKKYVVLDFEQALADI